MRSFQPKYLVRLSLAAPKQGKGHSCNASGAHALEFQVNLCALGLCAGKEDFKQLPSLPSRLKWQALNL